MTRVSGFFQNELCVCTKFSEVDQRRSSRKEMQTSITTPLFPGQLFAWLHGNGWRGMIWTHSYLYAEPNH